MELQAIQTTTTWNEAASRINSNNQKIDIEVEKLKNATYKLKGYFKTLSDLQAAFPTATVGSKAFVGLSYPYAIYLWENNSWVNSGATGGEESYDDTEIKEDIADLQAKDVEQSAKLTELSAEVDKLSEKIETLPSGESDVFKAVYGTTTYEEIKAAYEGGRVVHCDYNTYCYVLSRLTSTGAYFNALNALNAYRVDCTAASIWSNRVVQMEEKSNKVTSLSSASTDTQYPSAKAAFMAISKKSEVSLEALANGNLKVTIDGVSKDFMAAIPSGDPMHYAYVAAGAEYNDTGADIVRLGIYGDEIVWKAGYWWLNELGDITNEQMKMIYLYKYTTLSVNALPSYWQANENPRTMLSMARANITAHSELYTYMQSRIETIFHQNTNQGHGILVNNMSSISRANPKLTKVLNHIDCQYITSANAIDRPFIGCTALKEVRIKTLKYAISFQDSPLFSNASILYMIQNEAATSAIVISLHADAYARAMADAEITAALAAHPNVSLAKA